MRLLPTPQLAPLLVATTLAICFNPLPARAATFNVSNCNDSGAGSLRAAVANAASGDVVNLATTGCPRIVLTSGPIAITQNYLTLLGPGLSAMAIDGNGMNSVLRHTGSGTLRIEKLTIANGALSTSPALGGCIYGRHLIIKHSLITQCRADGGPQGTSDGGAIHARGNLGLYNSSVTDSEAVSSYARGAGVFVGGRLTLDHSRLRSNIAETGLAGGAYVVGNFIARYASITRNESAGAGGVAVEGDSYVDKSTFAGNISSSSPGALQAYGQWGVGTNVITNSTFSSNIAWRNAALETFGDTTIAGSTIAYNRELDTRNCDGALVARYLQLESSILARNTCSNGQAYDLGGYWGELTGGNNLIMRSRPAVPAGTLTADPQLGPLQLNGGLTKTHLPASTSPVIDAGNNVLALPYDQRGPGFPRVKGAAADIGAVER